VACLVKVWQIVVTMSFCGKTKYLLLTILASFEKSKMSDKEKIWKIAFFQSDKTFFLIRSIWMMILFNTLAKISLVSSGTAVLYVMRQTGPEETEETALRVYKGAKNSWPLRRVRMVRKGKIRRPS